MGKRVRTFPLFNDADYCGHVDPENHFEEEPYASMSEEEYGDLVSDYQDAHLWSSGSDIYVCELSPAGIGIFEWQTYTDYKRVGDAIVPYLVGEWVDTEVLAVAIPQGHDTTKGDDSG